MQYISKVKIDERLIRQVICNIDRSIAVLDKTNRAYNHIRLYLLKNQREQVSKIISMVTLLDKEFSNTSNLRDLNTKMNYYRSLMDQYNQATKDLAGLVLKNIGEYVNG